MQAKDLRKHLFYGTLLILLFIVALSSVFRPDLAGKIVTIACATILFIISAFYYFRSHHSLP